MELLTTATRLADIDNLVYFQDIRVYFSNNNFKSLVWSNVSVQGEVTGRSGENPNRKRQGFCQKARKIGRIGLPN